MIIIRKKIINQRRNLIFGIVFAVSSTSKISKSVDAMSPPKLLLCNRRMFNFVCRTGSFGADEPHSVKLCPKHISKLFNPSDNYKEIKVQEFHFFFLILYTYFNKTKRKKVTLFADKSRLVRLNNDRKETGIEPSKLFAAKLTC
jgi:hypothetical protein